MAKAGCSIVDISAGMYAYSAILAALLKRGRTGQGCRIDISLLESMADWMGFPLYYGFDGVPPPPRAGAMHASICPYGPFACGDGRTVMLGIQNEREWQSFCGQVLGQADLATDPRFDSNSRRLAARDEVDRLINARFSSMTTEQVIALLDTARIAFGEVNTIAGLWAHPQLAARGRWQSVQTEHGPVSELLPPGQTAARFDPVPRLGEHSHVILAELGYDGAEVSALKTAGVI